MAPHGRPTSTENTLGENPNKEVAEMHSSHSRWFTQNGVFGNFKPNLPIT